AEALLRAGRAEEALASADEALELLLEGEEPGEALPTLALAVEAAIAADEPPLDEEEMDGLAADQAQELALLVSERASEAAPARAGALLRETAAAFGREHPARAALLAAWPDEVPGAERAVPLAELVELTEKRGQRLGTISARTA